MTAFGPSVADWAGSCGGGGGDRIQILQCGTGKFIIGLAAQGATYVNRVRIRCGRIVGDDEIEDIGGWSAWAGSPSGGDAYGSSEYGAGYCPGEGVLRGLDVYCGSYLDRIDTGGCSVYEVGQFLWRTTSFSIKVGGRTGIRGAFECPLGEALYKIKVRSGLWIDRISGFCRRPPLQSSARRKALLKYNKAWWDPPQAR
jgi:hypothetical protein